MRREGRGASCSQAWQCAITGGSAAEIWDLSLPSHLPNSTPAAVASLTRPAAAGPAPSCSDAIEKTRQCLNAAVDGANAVGSCGEAELTTECVQDLGTAIAVSVVRSSAGCH